MRQVGSRAAWLAIAAVCVLAMEPALAALVERHVPYYASISAGRARMRTGPARTYPATWQYQRPDLPVRVLDTYEHGTWLKVEDPGGTQGWMLGALISDTRTAIVTGTIAELRDSPRFGGRTLWRAAPGVVGRINRCGRGWCYLDVRGRGGYVETTHLWGVEPQETVG